MVGPAMGYANREMRSLLKRLERADQPNVHVDVELWARIGSADRRDFEWSDRQPTDPEARCNGLDMCDAIAAGWPVADIRTTWKVPALTSSLDATVALLDRFGMSWSKSMEGFVCVHDRESAGTFRPDTASNALPIKLLSAMMRALGGRDDAVLNGGSTQGRGETV